jgi:hypothetical protein
VALWDLAAKQAGLPMHRLLGSRDADRDQGRLRLCARPSRPRPGAFRSGEAGLGAADAARTIRAGAGASQCQAAIVRLERFIVKWNQFCWLRRSRIFVRSARVVAQIYGQAVRTNRRPVSANPKGRTSFRHERSDRLGRTWGYARRQSLLS